MLYDLNVAQSIYESVTIASQFVKECGILVGLFCHLQLAISCSAYITFFSFLFTNSILIVDLPYTATIYPKVGCLSLIN